MNKSYALLLLVVLLLSLEACSVLKHAKKETVISKEEQVNYLKNIKANEFQFDWISMRSNVDISGTLQLPINNLNFNIRMRKDSIIWVSVSALLNIEGARFLITPDSIRIIDKLKNTYMVRPFDHIQKYIPVPVSFADLQNLIIGNTFLFNVEDSQLSKHSNELNTFISKLQFISNESQFSTDNHKLKEVLLTDHRVEQKSLLKYQTYTNLDEQLFPTKREVELVSKDSIHLSMNFSRVRVNQKVGFPFKTSAKYEKL